MLAGEISKYRIQKKTSCSVSFRQVENCMMSWSTLYSLIVCEKESAKMLVIRSDFLPYAHPIQHKRRKSLADHHSNHWLERSVIATDGSCQIALYLFSREGLARINRIDLSHEENNGLRYWLLRHD